MKQIVCESPRYKDFVCTFGCAYEPHSANNPCFGEIDPHHMPPVSAGGCDLDIINLCRKHHSQFHAGHDEVLAFALEHHGEIKRRMLAAWLMLIEQANGIAPAPQRKSKATSRGKNIQPLTKRIGQFPGIDPDLVS